MKIEGYAKEIADFFALGYYSSAYFKITIERVADRYNNGDATIAEKFPSDPPKHGEDCRPTWQGASKEKPIRFHGSPSGIVIDN